MQEIKLRPRKLIAIYHLIWDKCPEKEVFNAYYDIATDYTNAPQDNMWSFVCGPRRQKMLEAQRRYKRRIRGGREARKYVIKSDEEKESGSSCKLPIHQRR